jgi:hypothetical protein
LSGIRTTGLLALVAAIGCRGAAAGPDPAPATGTADAPMDLHGIVAPAGWEVLPAIAAAAVAAADQALAGNGQAAATAWGDRAGGCYAAVVELSGQRHDEVERIAAQLEHALRAAAEVSEWTASPGGEVATRFTVGGIQGQARAFLAVGSDRIPHLVAAACFYNDRNPAGCEASCTPLLARLEPPDVIP